MKSPGNFFNAIIRFILALLLIFCIGENYLLFNNYPLNEVHNPSVNDNDRFSRLLGWDNQPNMIWIDNRDIPVPGQENIDHLGRRYSGKDVKNPSKRLLFLGCSYAFGREISDNDTFVYKAAHRFPQYQFDNYAVIAYGTHQCRHKLEQLLLKPDCPKYDYVFYVYMHDHPFRNAYDYSSYLNNKQFLVGVRPYAELSSDGKLEYHLLDEQFLPFTHILRFSAFLNNIYAVWKSNHEKEFTNLNNIYNACLDDMLNVSKTHGLDLSVLILDVSEFSIHDELIHKGLNVYDIIMPNIHEPQYRVNNSLDHHPNGLAHDFWAEKLSEVLHEKIK